MNTPLVGDQLSLAFIKLLGDVQARLKQAQSQATALLAALKVTQAELQEARAERGPRKSSVLASTAGVWGRDGPQGGLGYPHRGCQSRWGALHGIPLPLLFPKGLKIAFLPSIASSSPSPR